MKKNPSNQTKKIVLLNQATLDSMMEKDNRAIIKNFTEVGIKILEADFGFAWWKFHEGEEYKLAYKSPNTPYEPTVPRENAGNYVARTTKKPFFDSRIKKENYVFDISAHLKSYIIIPIYYHELTYGSLVLCYKKQHVFTADEIDLATVLGTTTAQAITIHRLVVNEQKKHKREQMLKEVERSLRQEKLKTEFIANATHELRTPLAIIKGNADLALRGEKKDASAYQGALRAIDHEVHHLAGILADLTLLSAGDEGSKNAVAFSKVNLTAIIADTVARCEVLAGKKNISLIVKKAPAVTMLGNTVYLEKMLINLVRNSILYGTSGGVTRIAIEKSKGRVSISISDNGIGIPKDEVSHIFERFYRAKNSHASRKEGSGLGLAIVKQTAEVHGGGVSVKSAKNKGSVFTVTLPLRP